MAKAKRTPEQLNLLYNDAMFDLHRYASMEKLVIAGNTTPQAMVDMVGRWKHVEADAKKHINLFNDIIVSKLTPEQALAKELSGDDYTLNIVQVEKNMLDQGVAKEMITWLATQLREAQLRAGVEEDKLASPAKLLAQCHYATTEYHRKYKEN